MQRELADDERRAARVEQRAVELAGVVLEDPQPRDLAGEALGVLLRVARGDAEQDEQARADLAARRRARPRHALNDCSHVPANSSQVTKCHLAR